MRDDTISQETLLIALLISVDPILHKKEISEAALMAQSLKDSSIVKADVGVAATKALMLINDLDQANVKLQKSLLANPTDTRLQALDTQIKEERALTPAPVQ